MAAFAIKPPPPPARRHAITLHDGQWDIWNSKARTKVVVAGRRWGKTEYAVTDCLREAHDLHRRRVRNPLIWYITPTFNLARPVWDKIHELAPPGWITESSGTRNHPDTVSIGRTRIEFKSADNPSRLVSVGLHKAYIDEAGIIKEQVWTESIRPALIDHKAPALIIGTPKGRNWFYVMAQRGLDAEQLDIETFGGPSWENPYIDIDEVGKLRHEMYYELFRQEILAIFLEGAGTVFRNVGALAAAAVEKFGGKGFCDHPPRYIGIDLARIVDFTVLYGLCRHRHPAAIYQGSIERFNQIAWDVQRDRIVRAFRQAKVLEPAVQLFVDAAGIGDDTVQALQKRLPDKSVVGIHTGSQKRELIESYARTLDDGSVLIPDVPVVISEHESYTYEITRSRNISYHAPEGLHDDVVIAAALADYGRRRGPSGFVGAGG